MELTVWAVSTRGRRLAPSLVGPGGLLRENELAAAQETVQGGVVRNAAECESAPKFGVLRQPDLSFAVGPVLVAKVPDLLARWSFAQYQHLDERSCLHGARCRSIIDSSV